MVVSADRAAEANDAVLLQKLTEQSLRTIAPHARPMAVAIALCAPVPLTQQIGGVSARSMALASDAYPVMGATPVPYKQPASDKNGVMVTGVRVGSYTIKDGEGMVIESLPIDWHMLHTPHLQALRETADAIAARVAAIGS